MDMATVLEKHGLTLATVLSEDSLKSLVKAHSELLDTLTAETESQQNREKAVRDEIKKNVVLPPGYGEDLRNAIAKAIADEPDLLILFTDLLQEIKQEVMVMRDFHVASVARNNKPEKVKDSDEVQERKAEAEALRDTINSVWGLIGKPEGVIPTKKNKTNEVVLDLPRIPGGNTTGNVGRGAIVRQMRFTLDGQFLPDTVLFYDVLKDYINDMASGQVTDVKSFKALVENTGSEFAPKGYINRWTVELFDKKIEGWVPDESDEQALKDITKSNFFDSNLLDTDE
jgi:hypothetical protein